MDHTPYKKQKPYKPHSWSSSIPLPLTKDAARFPGIYRQVIPNEPSKIGVSYRSRRKREYGNEMDDSDLSVISYNSSSTFGRFDPVSSQKAPHKSLWLPSQSTQQDDQHFSQSTSQPGSNQIPRSDTPFTMDLYSSSPPHVGTTIDRLGGSNEQMVSTPENSYGHLDIEEHLDTPTEKWTTLSNADFSSRTQQPSRYLSSITDTPEKLQQQPPNVDDESYDKDDRYHGDSQHWLPPQTQPQPHMQPQSQPAIDNIGKIVDSKDEDHGDLAGSQGPYKQLEDDQILQALSWTLSNSVGGSQSVHLRQDKHGDYSDRSQTTSGLELDSKMETSARLTTNDDREWNKAHVDDTVTPPSQKSLGKRRATHDSHLDAPTVDMQHLEMRTRSPSVLSFHNSVIEEDKENESPAHSPSAIGQEMKSPSQVSLNFDYGADAVDIGTEEQSEYEPSYNIQRIDTDANLSRTLAKASDGLTEKKKYFTNTMINSLFQSGVSSATTLKGSTHPSLQKATNLFFDQICGDLEAYALHSGTTDINKKEVELLMTRQRVLDEDTSLEALAHEHLPRELWDQLCVSALADNYLYPQRR